MKGNPKDALIEIVNLMLYVVGVMCGWNPYNTTKKWISRPQCGSRAFFLKKVVHRENLMLRSWT
jgi:hypothetical protein